MSSTNEITLHAWLFLPHHFSLNKISSSPPLRSKKIYPTSTLRNERDPKETQKKPKSQVCNEISLVDNFQVKNRMGKEFVYPTIFSSSPTPAISNDLSLDVLWQESNLHLCVAGGPVQSWLRRYQSKPDLRMIFTRHIYSSEMRQRVRLQNHVCLLGPCFFID